MVTIRMASGETATVDDGEWTVVDNPILTRVLNSPAMQPLSTGYYAPSEDARLAEHVLRLWGGDWVASTEHAVPGKLY
jgi:hypothetical protein